MSKNTNRDYLIIVDVKSSNIREFNKLEFYINDKESHNIFVQLVIKESHDIINKYAPIDDPNLYELAMNIVKPTNEHKRITGKLISLEDGLYEFKLPQDCCDKVGTYVCELETIYNSRVTNSNGIKYRIKKSVLNDLDGIVDAPGYPIVIQLLDKLSDIEQYEEDRRANELARQLAEKQRQTRFDALDAAMVDRITAMDDKMVDVENRVSSKEQAVDTLIVDTKADIDEYKVAKDREIDEYKATKDTEINNAITAQDNKIDEAISNQNDRIAVVENNDIAQDNRLDVLETKATIHEERITATEAKNTEQDNRLDIAENRLANIGNDITNTMQPIIDEHTSRLDAIEAIDVAQNTRLDNIEVKNQEQDDRLLDIEKVNKRQDMNLKCLFAESKNNMIDITEEGNDIYLQNSTIGYTLIDEIKGNTLVNCNKEPNKELILNGNINTSGDNTVTITEGVDGGLVDVALEGNTLVNVSKTKDSTPISTSYAVENSGNHIALQGDVDGSCRPVITGNTLVNIGEKLRHNWDLINSGSYSVGWKNLDIPVKSASKYTFIFNYTNTTGVDIDGFRIGGKGYTFKTCYCTLPSGNGTLKVLLTSIDDISISADPTRVFMQIVDNYTGEVRISNTILLEGDYTDKPIPDYFEGLQSTFEDNLVTQEMIDNGEEVADNLGKYKVEYKVTGKNLFNCELEAGEWNNYGDKPNSTTTIRCSDFIEIKPNTRYIFSGTFIINNSVWIKVFSEDKTQRTQFYNLSEVINTPSWAKYMVFHAPKENIDINGTIQLEEGTEATAYEPYKGYTKTLYLNSPLLKGDTIEEKDGDIYHVHRSELVAYTEGDETSLITDKVNTLHGLETPTYELIEQSNSAIPSYANGHLDFNTAVPVQKVEFKPFSEELTYLYANTQYTLQFVSDRAITADITLGGTQLLAQSIVKGLNRISITTPATLADNKLIISGVGANISEVVVTDTNREFGYFEGMKSVGECEELAITSANSDNTLSNTQQLTHEPLRAVGDKKDRYVMIDGMWFIKKECGIRAYQEGDKDNYKTDLINTVYSLEMPTYEEIDYNPLEVYSGTTHITTNSAIPTNIVVKNHGYNCLLKPSTTYTVSSNLGINTVTTPSVLAEDCLRFMDTDTSDVTTMKDVLVLEGDWTSKADLIPANFSGIESAFEQEYDEAKGKYKVNVKVISKNLFNKDNIIIGKYHNCNIVTQNFKISSNRNCSISELIPIRPNTTYITQGVADPYHVYYDINKKVITNVVTNNKCFTTPNNAYYIVLNISNNKDNLSNIQIEQGNTATEYEPYQENNITFYIEKPLRGVGAAKDKVFIKDDKVVVQRSCGIRPYEDGDFGTYPTDKVDTVYPLVEPTYEEVEYNDTKLFIESFKNSTLSYNSNVPVTSKLYYSYSVPIVDTVAQTANISDEQDLLLVNMATEIAIMQLTL